LRRGGVQIANRVSSVPIFVSEVSGLQQNSHRLLRARLPRPINQFDENALKQSPSSKQTKQQPMMNPLRKNCPPRRRFSIGSDRPFLNFTIHQATNPAAA